jgi:glycosyltransferase involved in cell wall biosynthesis
MYGGTERVVAALANALVRSGEDVTLFASADSSTDATLVPMRARALRLDPHGHAVDTVAHLNMLEQVLDRAQQFDLLHFHLEALHFPQCERLAHKTVTTLHGRTDVEDLAPFYARWRSFPLVSISACQRRALPLAHWVATVHHGLPLDLFRPVPSPRNDYLAFLGRVSPEKRLDRAIRIAQQCGQRLKVAAKIASADSDYFHAQIEPLLDESSIEFVGEIGDGEKTEFLGNAAALLFPIDWPEPFGLVMIEAMACGTPVIAWRCGAAPEVVEDGLTGFLVDDEMQAARAVERARMLDRDAIRRRCEERFAAERMAAHYRRVYRSVLGRGSE